MVSNIVTNCEFSLTLRRCFIHYLDKARQIHEQLMKAEKAKQTTSDNHHDQLKPVHGQTENKKEETTEGT